MKQDKDLVKLINKLASESFKEGILNEYKVTKVIKLLKSQSKSNALFSLSEYLKALKRKLRKHILYIETTIPIASSQIKRIKKVLEKKIKITRVETKINPDILGGFRLKVGDEVWDYSILAKLNQVKEAIISGRSN